MPLWLIHLCLYQYSHELWAVSVCTVDGQRLSLGEVDQAFTLQSCSKPFTYAVCLEHLGHEFVHKYIGDQEICLTKYVTILVGRIRAKWEKLQ